MGLFMESFAIQRAWFSDYLFCFSVVLLCLLEQSYFYFSWCKRNYSQRWQSLALNVFENSCFKIKKIISLDKCKSQFNKKPNLDFTCSVGYFKQKWMLKGSIIFEAQTFPICLTNSICLELNLASLMSLKDLKQRSDFILQKQAYKDFC